MIAATVSPHSETLQKLIFNKMPVTLIDNIFDYEGNYDTVAIDNNKAAYAATQYLIKKGHQRIGLILGKLEELTGLEKCEGICMR